MLRVLGRVRLSRDTDASTSVERQRADIEDWARRNDGEVIGWAEDVDVSGSVDPFATPDLGPWLRAPRMNDWDVMAAWKWDRVSRGGQRPKQKLIDWMEDHGKFLVTIVDRIDTRSKDFVTEMQLTFTAESARSERQAISDRQTSSQKHLRKLGRYSGGPVPFGYAKVKRSDGWYIEPDPVDSGRIRSLIERYMSGESLSSLARRLNDAGAPSPKGGKWATSSLSMMFRSRALIGQSTHKGAVVVDESTGLPLQRAEPLIPADRWHELQERLDGAHSGRARKLTGKPALLLDVIFCGVCGSKMYAYQSVRKPTKTRRGFVNRYWKCSRRIHPRGLPACPARLIPAEPVEAFALNWVRTTVGDEPVSEDRFFPAEGVGAELQAVEDAIDGVRKEKDLGLYDGDEDSYVSRLRVLVARRNELRAVPNKPARYERVEIGGTWAEALDAAESAEDKRAVLLKLGMKMDAVRNDEGDIVATIVTDLDVLRKTIPGAMAGPIALPFLTDHDGYPAVLLDGEYIPADLPATPTTVEQDSRG